MQGLCDDADESASVSGAVKDGVGSPSASRVCWILEVSVHRIGAPSAESSVASSAVARAARLESNRRARGPMRSAGLLSSQKTLSADVNPACQVHRKNSQNIHIQLFHLGSRGGTVGENRTIQEN